ncbi:hypothetical protein QZH41_009672 [Actinostola sp. cb2023]|nr:hypothetical protein QZH41_009672 [Actinostola sp. cb2023]
MTLNKESKMVDNRSGHTVTFDLEDQPSGPHPPKTTDARKGSTPEHSDAATRIEKICKLVSILIVIVAFVVHLIRVLSTVMALMSTGCKYNHHNMHYTEGNITINFFWQANPDKSMENLIKQWIKEPKGRPQLIITGLSAVIYYEIHFGFFLSGLSNTRDSKHPCNIRVKNLTRVKQSIEVLSNINFKPKLKPSVSSRKSPFPESPVVVWMNQEPVMHAQLIDARKSITNKKIEVFNKIANDVFSNSSVKLVAAAPLVAKGHPKATVDGLHYGPPVSNVELDFILNFYCNNYMQVPDATCCVDIPRITRLQYNAIAVFVTWYGTDNNFNHVIHCDEYVDIVLFLIMFVCRWLWPSEHDGPAGSVEPTTPGGHPSSSLRWVYSDHMYPVMRNVAILGVIMCYFYLSDRQVFINLGNWRGTNLFFKEHKQYSNLVFGISMLAFLALGAYTWSPAEQVRCTSINNNMDVYLLYVYYLIAHGGQFYPSFKEQSDEWRGWMQLVILLYHYIGASKVMTRMNIFTVVLCLVMGRPYQFYYFVPLVSFWFVVVYITMAVFPRVSAASVREDPKQYIFIWLKFFVLFGVIYVVWTSPVLCDWLFSQSAVKELFIDENDSVREWRFRSWLDRYIVLYGMVFAFAYNTAKEVRVIDDTIKKRLFHPTHSTVTLILSALALGVYAIQAFTCSNKPSCNTTHSIASCVPITAFILLRNIPSFLRTKFSRVFTWVGSISLEGPKIEGEVLDGLFVGQYHIWLAKDTQGVLVLIPGQPLLNVVITTFVFVCICHEVHKVSGALTKALIARDITTMIRRLIIFVIALIIIWWHKTHHTLRPRLA